MYYSEDQISDLAELLMGTCQDISAVIKSLDMDESLFTNEDWSYFDDLVGECSVCGWWYERSEILEVEVDDEPVCDSCF